MGRSGQSSRVLTTVSVIMLFLSILLLGAVGDKIFKADVKALSFTVGSDTLNTDEWDVLDGVTANMVLDWTNATDSLLTTNTITGSHLYLDSIGGRIYFRDPISPTYYTQFYVTGPGITEDRSLSLVTGNANRTIFLSGDYTFDQSVAANAAPAFTADNFSDGGSNAIVTTTQETNWDNHIVDNSQAHSDYMLNVGDDVSGSYTFDTDTFVVDDVNDRVGIGTASPAHPLHISESAADVADGSVIQIDSILTSATNPQYGFHSRPTIAPSAASVQDYLAGRFLALSGSDNVANAGLYGEQAGVYYVGTGTLGTATGSYVKNYIVTAGTIDTSIGLRVNDVGVSGGGSVTTSYGIYIEDMASAGTNYAIYSAGGDSYFADTLTADQLVLSTTTVEEGIEAGYAFVGNGWGADQAMFCHEDHKGVAGAILQVANGTTYFNSASTKNIYFGSGGSWRIALSGNSPYHLAFRYDNQALKLGGGNDAYTYYDGANMILDPDVVGSGVVKIGATADDTIDAGAYKVGGAAGLSGTYSFGGGGSGDIATMTFTGGILTGTTTVP